MQKNNIYVLPINKTGPTLLIKKLVIRNRSFGHLVLKLVDHLGSGAVEFSNNKLRVPAKSQVEIEMKISRRVMEERELKDVPVAGYVKEHESFQENEVDFWLHQEGTEQLHQLGFTLHLKLVSGFSADETVVDIPGSASLMEAQKFATTGIDVSDTKTCRGLEEDTVTARGFGSKEHLLKKRRPDIKNDVRNESCWLMNTITNMVAPQQAQEKNENTTALLPIRKVHTFRSGPAPIPSPQRVMSADMFSFIRDFHHFIFDGDGVLWLGDTPIPGAHDLLQFLKQYELHVTIVTNNTTKTKKEFADKLDRLGFYSVSVEGIVTPSIVLADLLKTNNFDKKVYLIGERGVQEALDKEGIKYFGHERDDYASDDKDVYKFNLELEVPPSEVGAVVIAYTKNFNYKKLMKAVNYLKNPNCLFYATNEDSTTPGPKPDVVIPDAGPLIAAVQNASGRTPTFIGKPHKPMWDYVNKYKMVKPHKTIMIGDRTNTDVKFGRDHGASSLLVLSGCHQLSDVLKNQNDNRIDLVPNYYATSVGEMVPR